MKAVLVLLATVISFSAQAHLESHYGVLKQSGLSWKCTLMNETGRTLDLKYVVFSLTPLSGDNSDEVIQNRVDTRVQPGYSITAKIDTSTHAHGGNCRFLER